MTMRSADVARQAEWRFVDTDASGDGALWLEHPTQLPGWVDFRRGPSEPWLRIMVVARSFVEAGVRDIGRESRYTIFAAMLVVPDGSPASMRACIDEAMRGGGPAVFGTPVEPDA